MKIKKAECIRNSNLSLIFNNLAFTVELFEVSRISDVRDFSPRIVTMATCNVEFLRILIFYKRNAGDDLRRNNR